MNKKPVWIDTDTGVDDAVALVLASTLKQIELVGASAVAGNKPYMSAEAGFMKFFRVQTGHW